MHLALVVIGFGIAAVVATTVLRFRSPKTIAEAATLRDRLDLAALQNLLSKSERDYLRSALNHQEYRSVERERAKAALFAVAEIIKFTAGLSKVFEREAHQHSQEKTVQELVSKALEVRILAMKTFGALVIHWVLPHFDFNLDLVSARALELLAFCDRTAPIQHST
jgi:hypothetical protein